eukprot:gb/GECG01016793.1/.p1 GENE.gb/GECG01016793.1/~~gb/GECG01016793.1/.p1  ORF type:complete len:916 (+),score=100.48 gb/GECG01016793.1/:1-2748(+)
MEKNNEGARPPPASCAYATVSSTQYQADSNKDNLPDLSLDVGGPEDHTNADDATVSTIKHWMSEEEVAKYSNDLSQHTVTAYVEVYQRQRFDSKINNWRPSPKNFCPFSSDPDGYFPLYSLCSEPYPDEEPENAWRGPRSFVPFQQENPLHSDAHKDETTECWHSRLHGSSMWVSDSSAQPQHPRQQKGAEHPVPLKVVEFNDGEAEASNEPDKTKKVDTRGAIAMELHPTLSCSRHTEGDVRPASSTSLTQLVAAELAIAGGLCVPHDTSSPYSSGRRYGSDTSFQFSPSVDSTGWVWDPHSEWQVELPDSCVLPGKGNESQASNSRHVNRTKWEYEKIASSGGWEYATAWDEPFTFRPRPPTISSIGIGSFKKSLGGERVRRRKWIRKVIATPHKMKELYGAGFLLVEGNPGSATFSLRFPLPRVKLHSSNHLVFLLHGVGNHGKEKMARKVNRMYSAFYEAVEQESVDARVARIDLKGISWHSRTDTDIESNKETLRYTSSNRASGRSSVEADEDSDSDDSMGNLPQTPLQMQRSLSGPISPLGSVGRSAASKTTVTTEILPNDLPGESDDQTQSKLHQVSSLLSTVKLSTLPRLRNFISNTLVNGANYFGPFGDRIRAHVAKQLNLQYKQYLIGHPCVGKTEHLNLAIFGHSLGGVIAFDLLSSKSGRLCFSPRCFFSMGSPIALYLTTRGLVPEEIKRKYKALRKAGIKYFNLYHDCDPVAMRLSPLLAASLQEVSSGKGIADLASPYPFSVMEPESTDAKYFLKVALQMSRDELSSMANKSLLRGASSKTDSPPPPPPRRGSSKNSQASESESYSESGKPDLMQRYFASSNLTSDPFAEVEEEANELVEAWKQGEPIDFEIPRGQSHFDKLDYIAARNAHRAYWSSPGLVAFAFTMLSFSSTTSLKQQK